MKINEILTEGPLDTIKSAFQGAKTGWKQGTGAIPGAIQGYKQGQAVNTIGGQAGDVATTKANTANRFASQWLGTIQADPDADPAELSTQLTGYTQKLAGGPQVAPFRGNPRDVNQVQKYMTLAFAAADRAKMGGAKAPTTTPTTSNAAPTSTTGNTAPTTGTTGNTASTTGNVTPAPLSPEEREAHRAAGGKFDNETGQKIPLDTTSNAAPTTGNVAPTTSTTSNSASTSTTTSAPTMSKQQISQWISRNSEDAESLKAFLDGTAPKTSAPSPDFSKTLTGYKTPTMNVPTGIPTTSTMMPSNMIGSKPPAPTTAPAPKEDSQAEIKKALDARRAAGLMAEGKRK
jgi:hypothetical protein